jgi:uncharacterized protein
LERHVPALIFEKSSLIFRTPRIKIAQPNTPNLHMKLLAAVLALFLLNTLDLTALEIPKLQARVNDYANIFSEEQAASLEKQLYDEEKATSNQIVILTVTSLQGLEVEDYAHKVFRAWRIGQADKDNGLLILHDTGGHHIWLQTGRGLEGAVPDATAKEISVHMSAYFKQGNFFEGYQTGIKELMASIGNEYKPAVTSTKSTYDVYDVFVVLAIIAGAVVILFLLWLLFGKKEEEVPLEPISDSSTGRSSRTRSASPSPRTSESSGYSAPTTSVREDSSTPYSDPSPPSFQAGGGNDGGGGAGSSY